jgi:hypothetical protein
MELFVTVLAVVTSLIALDVASILFGSDSRESIGDSWAR